MQRPALTALFVLTLCMAAPVLAADTVSLDDVETAETQPLDAVDGAGTETLDSLDGGRMEPLDAVKDARMIPASEVDSATAHALDSEPRGEMQPLDSAEDGSSWSAPVCAEVPVEIPAALPATDNDGWSARLSAAERELEAAEARLRTANAAYTRSITRNEPRGQERAAIVAGRDAARHSYGHARCELPALVESARRAGVEAEVLRSYR